MARKKKSLKDSQESVEDPLAEDMTSSTPMDRVNKTHENSVHCHASDSEIFDSQKGRKVQKNKSNLFLIKSYSFIDKSNARRPKATNVNVNEKLKDFENFHKTLRQDVAKEKQEKENENMEKALKKGKHKKLKKSKSTYDSTEDLEEFQSTLRQRTPSIIVEGEVSDSTKRPLTFDSESHHRPVVKSKTMEDIETSPLIKRESFIRHSLQSIRRSFSSSKKTSTTSASSSTFVSSSSSSCSTSSSETSNSLKKSKAMKKDLNCYKINNKENKKDTELQRQKNSESHSSDNSSSCGENINNKTNDTTTKTTPHHPPQLATIDLAKSSSSSSCTSSTSTNSSSSSSATSGSAASAGLSVLKEEDEKDLQIAPERSTSSVSTLTQFPSDSLAPMAPLQTHAEAHSVECLNTITGERDNTTTTTTSGIGTATTGAIKSSSSSSAASSSPPQQTKSSKRLHHQQSIGDYVEATSIGCATSSEYSSARSLKHSSSSLAPLQSVPSTASLRSISPSRPNSTSSSTAKHEQSSAAASAAGAAAAAAGATTSTGSASNATTPPEKEKKRKEVSSSRVKKFHRHFSQVSKDEKLINYFSCALVSDILLQGHLYITDQHFAFYSNVFGYVTKVVIPTSSVTKISKEKTAKIIPNAVGVATADERHVFGSFISREAAFRLMVSVCSPLAPAEILVKDPATADIPEEYSIEDDSSCSISGNESPAQVTENGNSSNENHHSDTQLLRRTVGNSNLSIAEEKHRHSDIPLNAKSATSAASLHHRTSAPPAAASSNHYGNGTSNVIAGGGGGIAHIISKISSSPATAIGCATIEGNLTFIAAGSASTTTSATTTPTPSTSSSPTTVMALPHAKAYQFMNKLKTLSNRLMANVKFPTEIHVVYMGVTLSVLLAVFTVFLLYRILDIEAKTSVYRSPIEFNWHSGNDDDIFAEALRFQKQLQLKSTEEAQNILKTNLEQIAKVRRSLETLSMLIHDRSSSFSSSPQTDDSD